MKFTRFFRCLVALTLSLILTGTPQVASAEMVSTREAVGELARSQTIEHIREYLARTEVREQMAKHRVDANEVSTKLASMNNSELRQINNQITMARAGGDAIIISLTTVLIVILILLLIGRI